MKKETSFSEEIKTELCNIAQNSDEKNLAILSSYIKINGSIRVSKDKNILFLKTENSKIAKFLYELLNKYFSIEAHFVYEKSIKLLHNTEYIITIDKNIDKLLDTLKISFIDDTIDRGFINSDQKFYGYIAGAFLSCGSCNSPKSSNYHLELAFSSPTYASSIQSLINNYKNLPLNMRLIKRRNLYVIYLKKSSLISSFLIMIGAVESCMSFENVRVDRDYANTENRLLNLDGANMEKQYSSAKKQIENIKYLDKIVGIDSLINEKLILFCRLRLLNVDASMSEIAKMLSKKLDINISKGQVYHLSKKVEVLAKRNGKK